MSGGLAEVDDDEQRNYARLKCAPIELTGVFCMGSDPLVEVAPDMHAKFIIFGEEDCILGSFNVAFDRWWANWESGMTFRSRGVCRLLDNVFQSIRGGVIQPYVVDPLSRFNLLYTFGRQTLANGKYYRPHQAIISAIHRARRSIKPCLFLINELRGEYQDNVVDAMLQAKRRGVNVEVIVNGHWHARRPGPRVHDEGGIGAAAAASSGEPAARRDSRRAHLRRE